MSIDLKKNIPDEKSDLVIHEPYFTIKLSEYLNQHEQYCIGYEYKEGNLILEFVLTEKNIKQLLFQKKNIRHVAINIFTRNPRHPDNLKLEPITILEEHLKFLHMDMDINYKYLRVLFVYKILE